MFVGDSESKPSLPQDVGNAEEGGLVLDVLQEPKGQTTGAHDDPPRVVHEVRTNPAPVVGKHGGEDDLGQAGDAKDKAVLKKKKKQGRHAQ